MGTKDGKGIKILAAIGLIITTIIWGSAFVVMKNSVDIISPTYLLALRFTIAAIALILVFWRKVMKINKSDLFCGGLLGVFLFVSYFFQTYGLKYTTVSGRPRQRRALSEPSSAFRCSVPMAIRDTRETPTSR